MLQFSFNVSNVHLILSHLMWGDPQNKQNEFQVWTLLPYLMKKKKKASGISCMNPYPMKMKKSKMNFKYEQ